MPQIRPKFYDRPSHNRWPQVLFVLACLVVGGAIIVVALKAH
jgi:hypothetical protein